MEPKLSVNTKCESGTHLAAPIPSPWATMAVAILRGWRHLTGFQLHCSASESSQGERSHMASRCQSGAPPNLESLPIRFLPPSPSYPLPPCSISDDTPHAAGLPTLFCR